METKEGKYTTPLPPDIILVRFYFTMDYRDFALGGNIFSDIPSDISVASSSFRNLGSASTSPCTGL